MAGPAPGAATVESGTGLIGSVAGVSVFLCFVLFAVQIAYDLYATSAVTAAAFDAARVVAGAEARGDHAAVTRAEADARRVLGTYGERVRFEWSVDDDHIAVRVQATNPGFLPAAVRRPLGVDHVDRTVRARVERVR